MTKSLKIILFILLILVVSVNISFVQATEGEDFSEAETFEEDVPSEEETANDDSQEAQALSTFNSSVTNVSSINSYEQANLELNNILSIILIAIGVLLILFAIALLIRISKK